MIGRLDELDADANAVLVARFAVPVDLLAFGGQAKAEGEPGVVHEFQQRARPERDRARGTTWADGRRPGPSRANAFRGARTGAFRRDLFSST